MTENKSNSTHTVDPPSWVEFLSFSYQPHKPVNYHSEEDIHLFTNTSSRTLHHQNLTII